MANVRLLETDPIDLLLTADGDMFVGPNGTEFSRGLSGVAQAAVVRMRLFLNEWFLNLDAGIDWWAILGEKLNDQKVREEITRELLATPGIKTILQLDMVFDDSTRNLAITWAANTIFGDILPNTVQVPIG